MQKVGDGVSCGKSGCTSVLLHLCAATVRDNLRCLPFYRDVASSGMIYRLA